LPDSSYLDPPYDVTLKPYGMALLELATERKDIVCIGADLTRQTETDIFRDAIPERFINVGMAEANMIGIAGAMARAGNTVFVNTFGVFCTRRCFDQIAMAVAYPNVNVKIVGFMPGLSSPGGPSHQAIDDIALMRSLPNMTIVDVVDATDVRQAVRLIAERPGPAYLRLKRGEAPRIFRDDHQLLLEKAQVLRGGKESDVCLIASGMMLPTALSASSALERVGLTVTVVHVPVIKPLDHATVAGAASKSRLVVTADNHNVIGGLGSAVAEAMAEHAVGVPLRRMGVKDVFAESGSREYLFHRYGLGTQAVLDEVWRGLGRGGAAPVAPPIASTPGAYAPV
jgi:transketolase